MVSVSEDFDLDYGSILKVWNQSYLQTYILGAASLS